MKLEHILDSARAAYRMGSTGYLSTGESLAAAVVLERHDWLNGNGYSALAAFKRIADDRPLESVMDDLIEAKRIIREEIDRGELVQEGER